MRLTLSLYALVIILPLIACAQSSKIGPRLRKVVAISGENGSLVSSPDTITVFSRGTISIQEADGEWRIQEKERNSVSIQIRSTRWQRIPTTVQAFAANEPLLCDSLNQVNIGESAPPPCQHS